MKYVHQELESRIYLFQAFPLQLPSKGKNLALEEAENAGSRNAIESDKTFGKGQ